MQFFSSDKGLQEIFFEIIHTPPPQELNGRPLKLARKNQMTQTLEKRHETRRTTGN